ncbi:type IV pili twitching motility protein PilT [Candidatus Endobugula sertula]|uniref:Type IV pili twitching motility protein PilT n=1 Tax=Candidatus Endobugula sertula TaxID=62101 RepID=A0A1D2QRD1_9GAMM|nr:type IV pili twitching motility protein PilT [Candidatus Endobugula sertula]
MDIEKLLKTMADKKASDLFLTADMPPAIKLHGQLIPLANTPLSAELSRQVVLGVMNEKQRTEFIKTKELNFAITVKELGRFRCNAFYHRNLIGMVIRRIETVIPKLDQLGLPKIIKELTMAKRGLVVVVGATGSGKSTSLAAMIGHRNLHSKGHIISIEDPIEFIHQHQHCIVTQREIGLDTESYEVALKNALRQAPNVIVISEVRTRETMEHAIAFAETGHLCLCTLHANNANQALDRIFHFFPADRHQQLWMDLSLNLKAMVAQQLIPSSDGKERRVCLEVLLNTPLVSDLIRKGKISELKELMKKSTELGMQTFDQALFALYNTGEISYEDALSYADSSNDLRLMIKLDSESDTHALSLAADSLELE